MTSLFRKSVRTCLVLCLVANAGGCVAAVGQLGSALVMQKAAQQNGAAGNAATAAQLAGHGQGKSGSPLGKLMGN